MEPVILFKHPKYHTYYVRFSRMERPPNGKLVSMKKIVGYTVTDERKAREILKELRVNWHKRKVIELSGSVSIKISELPGRYEADPDRVNLSADTHRADRNALKQLSDTIGDKSVRSITKHDLKQFKAVLLGRGCSAYTINTYRRHINAALRWAKENGYTSKVPKSKKVKTPDQLPRVLSKSELDSILAACRRVDADLHRMATFALWTGCRRREVLGVNWQDMRGVNMLVRGKGKRERMIPLLPQAREVMGEPMDIGRVFPNWHPDTVSHRFAEACEKAGVDARFHDIRHTSATNMLSNGIPLPVVQKILGHADIRTTQIYAKVVDEIVQAEMQKLKF